jgi:hypothetical protein
VNLNSIAIAIQRQAGLETTMKQSRKFINILELFLINFSEPRGSAEILYNLKSQSFSNVNAVIFFSHY